MSLALFNLKTMERIASTGIVIDFYGVLSEDGKTLTIYDKTKPQKDVTDTIYDLRLSLTTDFMVQGVYEIDLISYIYSNRKDREWYVITSDMVGLGEDKELPDGIYTVTIRVNNTYSTTHTFVVFKKAYTLAKSILTEAGYKVTVSTNNFEYQNSTKYDWEKMTIISTLVSAMEMNSLDGNIEAVKSAFKQLNRILNIK